MATDFSALSASAQGQGVVSVAVATMLAGLATMLAGLNSADAMCRRSRPTSPLRPTT